jgi:DNA-binding NarL/FixJ family response regulator
MIRVLLVDDRWVVRRGLMMRLAVEPDLQVVGAAKDKQEALFLARTTAPDVVVMDVEMRDGSGFQTIHRIRDLRPDSAVVVLTMYGNQDAQARALGAGAQAFVEKQGKIEPLLQEIRRLAGGGSR